jgi:sulfur-carrier protein
VKVEILYFAAVRDLVGVDAEVVELPAAVGTVRELVAFLEQARPALAGRMGHVRIARNETFATAGEPIAEGDVLALIPPVAGG